MPRLRTLFAALLLAALFVPAAATAQTVPAPTAAQLADLSTCLLPSAAFCDNFNEGAASGSARSGALDESRWSVSHVTGDTNPGKGQANEFYPSDYMHCMDPKAGLLPPSDYFMCAATMPDGTAESMHMMEAFNDHGNYDYNSAMIRQPFDFAGRTGTIAFDVDAKTDGAHMWWPELWITDQPVPAPHANESVDLPRNGVGIEFASSGPAGTAVSTDAAGTGLGNVSTVSVVNNYTAANVAVKHNGYYQTQPDRRNRFQVRLSQDDLQVWATDADGTNFREVADAPGINLDFTRGYVAVQHAQYNPEKYGITGQVTYHWDNIGFDGPVLPPDRGYSVPDALSPGHDAGTLNLAYMLSGTGIATVGQGTAPHAPFAVAGVDTAGAVEADLTLNVWDDLGGSTTLTYRVNSGPPITVPYPSPGQAGWGRAIPLVLPVPLADLADGTNTVALSSATNLVAGNIDLVLRMSAPGDPGTTTTTFAATATGNGQTFGLSCSESNGDIRTISCKAA